jgi:hypothetical protein
MIPLSILLFVLVLLLITGIHGSVKPRRIPKGTKELPGPKGHSPTLNLDIINKY